MSRQIQALGDEIGAGIDVAGDTVKVELRVPRSPDRLKIKLEAESKHELATDAVDSFEGAVRKAERAGLGSIVSAAARPRFERFRIAAKHFATPLGADDDNVYYDDAYGTLVATGASLSTRIADSSVWRIVAKLPPLVLSGSAVLARVEITRKLAEPRPGEPLGGAMGDDGFDPVTLLARALPALDPDSLSPRLRIADARKKYDIFGADGAPAYVLTVDRATATDLGTGATASFSEVEIERNDGSTAPAALRELIALSTAVAGSAALAPLLYTKPQRAARLVRAE